MGIETTTLNKIKTFILMEHFTDTCLPQVSTNKGGKVPEQEWCRTFMTTTCLTLTLEVGCY